MAEMLWQRIHEIFIHLFIYLFIIFLFVYLLFFYLFIYLFIKWKQLVYSNNNGSKAGIEGAKKQNR